MALNYAYILHGVGTMPPAKPAREIVLEAVTAAHPVPLMAKLYLGFNSRYFRFCAAREKVSFVPCETATIQPQSIDLPFLGPIWGRLGSIWGRLGPIRGR